MLGSQSNDAPRSRHRRFDRGPATVVLEDYRRSLIVFLQANPQDLKKASSEVVAASFSADWPCKD